MRRYLLGSIAIHFLIFAFTFFEGLQKSASPESVTYTEVEFITAERPPESQKNKKSKKIEMKNRVVDQNETPLNEEIPEDSRFLSAHNQTVKKQTQALVRGEFKNREAKGSGGGRWQAFQPQSQQLRKMEISQNKLGNQPETKPQPSTALTGQEALPPGEAGQGSKSSEVSATLDYIDEVDAGLETLLSTREFVYYTYYRRIRTQLNQHWTPRVRDSVREVYRKGRRIASAQDLVTRTIVVLSPEGDLVKVQVIGNSGFRELDGAALDALKEATPFKNPPRGMIDQDGYIRIRWDFVIEG